MDDLRVAAVARRRPGEQRRRLAPREPRQEAVEPRAERGRRQHAPHQVGLDQRRRQEIRAGRLPRRRRVAVVRRTSAARASTHARRQRGCAGATRVVEREREAERAVRMHAVRNGYSRARQVVEVARAKRRRAAPAPRPPACAPASSPRADSSRELSSHAQPYVRSNVAAAGRAQIRASAAIAAGAKWRSNARRSPRARGSVRKQPAQAREQPVHVHARVPVEAAVERRMQRARRTRVVGAGEHVVELVRVLAHDVGERDAREARARVGIEGSGMAAACGRTRDASGGAPIAVSLLRGRRTDRAMNVFVTGGTGYVGRALIPVAAAARPPRAARCVRARIDRARVRQASRSPATRSTPRRSSRHAHAGSDARPPGRHAASEPVEGGANSNGSTLASIRASVAAATRAGVAHLVYVSVAQPAPLMRAYVAVRAAGEDGDPRGGLTATCLRPWYVLGPGHRWPLVLVPLYRVAEWLPAYARDARGASDSSRLRRWRRAGARGRGCRRRAAQCGSSTCRRSERAARTPAMPLGLPDRDRQRVVRSTTRALFGQRASRARRACARAPSGYRLRMRIDFGVTSTQLVVGDELDRVLERQRDRRRRARSLRPCPTRGRW